MLKTKLLVVTLFLTTTTFANAGSAKYVLFFLGDGMGPVNVTMSRIAKYGEAGSLNFDKLSNTGRVRTYSLDAQTTDSAPSMSAYTTGVKMNNDVISSTDKTLAFFNYGTSSAQSYNYASTPYTGTNSSFVVGTSLSPTTVAVQPESACPTSGNGGPVTTILELAKAAGRSTGVVTTTRVTHATPAATYAHICNRDGENQIASQLVKNSGDANPVGAYNTALGNGVDVILGGGRRHFLPSTASGSKRLDANDLTAKMVTNGYTYVTDKTALANIVPSASTKILGLFTASHMSYDYDRQQNQSSTEPSLSDMTSKAIDVLAQNSNGFYLMVEGGRIDHALHDTNPTRAVYDTIAFDTAIQTALTKMATIDPGLANTIVVVTADHDHTISLGGYAMRSDPVRNPAGVLGVSKNVATKRPDLSTNDVSPFPIINFGNGATSGGTDDGSTNSLRGINRGALTDAITSAASYHSPVAVNFSTGAESESHGGGDVWIYSTGANSNLFKGTMVNTEVFNRLRAASGL
jgi:alkaline phosphatase